MTLAALDRYDRRRVSTVGERAVVVGGSIAGLCAARVLADAFGEVVVIERDPLPDEPVVRDGAPQTRHLHALLEAGRSTLSDLLPEFEAGLASNGAVKTDAATDLSYYVHGDVLADGPEPLPMYCGTRPLFEYVIRRQVADVDGVTLRDNCQFTEYRLDGDTVTGIDFRDETDTEQRLDAALVVDATGRTSRTPQWLAEHGFSRPPVEDVEIGVTYSEITVERPPGDHRVYFVPPSPPRTRGCFVVPVENERWNVVLQGTHGEDPPTAPDTFVDWLGDLPVSDPKTIVTRQPWVDGIQQYPFPSSRRRRYEHCDRFPDGLLVTGDAIASFNPIYGQGMTVAALDALALHHALAAGGRDALADRFFARTADIVDTAWKLAVGADFEFPATTGPKPRGTDLFNRYIGRLRRRAHDDGVLTDAFYRVVRMERPPTALLRPRVLWRVLRPRTGVLPNP